MQRQFVSAKGVVKYVALNFDKLMLFRADAPSKTIQAYSDSDWTGYHDTRRQTTDAETKGNRL